jgi:hypothetical protein
MDVRDEGRTLARAGWILIAGIAAANLALATVLGFRIAWASTALPAVGVTLLAVLGFIYTRLRPDPRIATTLACVAQLIAFTAVAAPLSYLMASLGGPLWDDTFLALDRRLGLNWRAYLAFVNDNPGLGFVFTIAYQSLIPQMIIAAGALGLSGRIVEAHVFVFASAVSGLASVVISAACPAVAMFVHLGLRPEDFPALDPAAAYVHVAALEGLRDGTLRTLSLDGAEGIITFPSYHAALGVIFIAAFWPLPVLRWIGLALNLALIAATPIDGGHYFVDVFSGIAIALASLHIARSLARRPARAADPSLRPALGH